MKPTLLLLSLTFSLFAAERPAVTVLRQTSEHSTADHVGELEEVVFMGVSQLHLMDQRCAGRVCLNLAAKVGGELPAQELCALSTHDHRGVSQVGFRQFKHQSAGVAIKFDGCLHAVIGEACLAEHDGENKHTER